MPKETFFNLPEEKREKIIEEAIEEFAQYNYDSASINRIIERSGISKGSFYQYFEDKKDVYKYLMTVTVERKLKYISPVMMNPEKLDIFTLIRELYVSGLSFAGENPKLVDMGNKLLGDRQHPLYNELLKDNFDVSRDYFAAVIEKAKAAGEVRPDIDSRLVAYILTMLNVAVVDYYRINSSDGNWLNGMMDYVEKLLDFVHYGIGTDKPMNDTDQ